MQARTGRMTMAHTYLRYEDEDAQRRQMSTPTRNDGMTSRTATRASDHGAVAAGARPTVRRRHGS